MLKNWKSLFVKTDGESSAPEDPPGLSFSAPENNVAEQPKNKDPVFKTAAPRSVVDEVIATYESGLESINMPGYDFYEFYKSVSAGGTASAQLYQMAFQMAKAFDKNVSAQKLLQDAEFYISKINEVHGQYVSQGQQKLNAIQQQRKGEQLALQQEIDYASQRVKQLKEELGQLGSSMLQKQQQLAEITNKSTPQENDIREKLQANDMAQKQSIEKLTVITNGIRQFIKE